MEGYLGTIMMCGFQFAPRAWATCNGALVSVNQNQALFSLIGTIFGGNGRTDFALPNLNGGRAPGGKGSTPILSDRRMGDSYGREACKPDVRHMPSHTHQLEERVSGGTLQLSSSATLAANKTTPDSTSPENNYCAPTKSGLNLLDSYAATPDATMNSGAIDIETTGILDLDNLEISNAGGDTWIPMAQPTLILNFVICTIGTYPSRS